MITGSYKKFGRRYPWSEWFSTAEFALRRGEHYGCYTASMAYIVRAAAASRGIAVEIRTHEDGNGITVQVK